MGFDLQQLVRVAVGVCEGAQSCALLSSRIRNIHILISTLGTKVTKCLEGLHNKAFILTRDFIGLAKDDDERELFTKLWPYQEPADTEGL